MVFKKDLSKFKKKYTQLARTLKTKICKNYKNVQDINSNSLKLQI